MPILVIFNTNDFPAPLRPERRTVSRAILENKPLAEVYIEKVLNRRVAVLGNRLITFVDRLLFRVRKCVSLRSFQRIQHPKHPACADSPNVCRNLPPDRGFRYGAIKITQQTVLSEPLRDSLYQLCVHKDETFPSAWVRRQTS